MFPHLPVEWRPHLRITEVELGDIDLRLGRSEFGFCFFRLKIPVVDNDLCRGAFLLQGRIAFNFRIGVEKRRLLRLDLGFGLRELSLVLLLLDREKQIALLDDRTVEEVNLVQISFHPGDQLDRVDGCGIAGELDIFAHALNLWQDHLYRRAGGRRLAHRLERLGPHFWARRPAPRVRAAQRAPLCASFSPTRIRKNPVRPIRRRRRGQLPNRRSRATGTPCLFSTPSPCLLLCKTSTA